MVPPRSLKVPSQVRVNAERAFQTEDSMENGSTRHVSVLVGTLSVPVGALLSDTQRYGRYTDVVSTRSLSYTTDMVVSFAVGYRRMRPFLWSLETYFGNMHALCGRNDDAMVSFGQTLSGLKRGQIVLHVIDILPSPN